jgi:hypothetical protein
MRDDIRTGLGSIVGVGDKDLEEVRELYKRLRELVIQNPGGWDDAASRERVEALCDAGIAALEDAECHARLRTVQEQARELYSASGHRAWQRSNMSGADYLRLQMLIALEALNTRLFFIDALRGRQSMAQS